MPRKHELNEEIARITVYVNRYPGQPDSVVVYAETQVDSDEIRGGRRKADVDITDTLTQAELRAAQKFLDSVEAKLRAEWGIA